MMFLTLGLHALVIVFSPRTPDHGLSGPFEQALSDKYRCLPTPMRPELPATFLADRSYSRILLKACRIRIAQPVGAECDRQSRRQDFAGTGQIGKDGLVLMRGEDRRDLGSKLFDVLVVSRDEFHEQF